MKITHWEKIFALEAAEIDAFSEKIDEALCEIKAERQNRLRIRLSLEEALLRMRDRFGEEAEVFAEISSRFGRPFIQIELEGDAYNPLSKRENDLEDWNSSLLTAVGLSPRYSFSNGTNILKLTLPHKGINPVIKILLALAIGVLIGVSGVQLVPDHIQNVLARDVLAPFYDLWLRILNVISGPVVFLMVITTLLNAGKITERGGDSKMVIIRYFVFSFLIAAPGAFISSLVFRVPFVPDQAGSVSAGDYLDTLFKLVPNEVVTPFMESQTPQLLMIAIVLGTALSVIGQPVRHLSNIVKQANMVGLQLTDWVSRLVPYFMAILIGYEMWIGEAKPFYGIWKAMLLAFVTAALIMLFIAWYVCLKKQVRLSVLIKKLWKPFWVALSTGSLDDAFGLTEQSCVRELGIDKEFTTVSIPHGLVMYMPVSAVGTLVFTVYVAHLYEVATSPVWYLIAIVISVVVFVATPPVPGANLIAYTVLFPTLGIPGSALIDAMVFDIIFGLFAGAGNQLLLQLELILQAGKIGLLNRKILKKDMHSKKVTS